MLQQRDPLDRAAVPDSRDRFGADDVAYESNHLHWRLLSNAQRGQREDSITRTYPVYYLTCKGGNIEETFL